MHGCLQSPFICAWCLFTIVAEKQVEGQKRSVDVEGRIFFYIETSGFKGFYNMFHVNILNQSLSKGLMA